MASSQVEMLLRSRVNELTQQVRENDDLARALQAGEVDAIVILQKRTARVQRPGSDEPLYRTMIDELPHGVATVLTDGTVVYANRAIATMLTGAHEELAGADLGSHVVEPHRAMFNAMLQRAVASPQELEVSLMTATGEAPVLMSALRLPIAAHVGGFSGSSRDLGGPPTSSSTTAAGPRLSPPRWSVWWAAVCSSASPTCR